MGIGRNIPNLRYILISGWNSLNHHSLQDIPTSLILNPPYHLMRQIVIARPDLAFADTLSEFCHQVFDQAEITICTTGQSALNLIDSTRIDLLLLSLNFVDIDATELLLKSSQHDHIKKRMVFVDQRFKPILAALRTARVNAIIDTQTESLSAVKKSLQNIDNQEIYISPSLEGNLLNDHPDALDKELTAGETRVLQVIGYGYDNSEAAQILNLMESTVQTHRRNIMKKLNISTSAKLVREAICLGYVRISEEEILARSNS